MSWLLRLILTSTAVLAPHLVAAQPTALCRALADAGRTDAPAYADSIAIGQKQVDCAFEKEKTAWFCSIKALDKCSASPTSDPAGSTQDNPSLPLVKELRDAYDTSLKEVVACFPGLPAKPLDYRKIISPKDAFVSQGRRFQSASPDRFIYLMQRFHAFAKDKETCLVGSTELEVEPETAFSAFPPDTAP